MNLSARFANLKKQVGGNREKQGYELALGRTVCESLFITEPSACIRRILSELHFALHLSQRYDNCFNQEIENALSVLEICMAEEGVLTRSACLEAERCLLPLQESAREYEVIFVSHAHIDMNWMWGWQETVAITLSTFRTILNMMNEYPDFTYSQSQASVYKIVEEHDPEMMKEIQARIAEGRWEVTASAWVETDKNMPDTESMLRHIGVTRDYLHNVWGIDPDLVKVDFSPDTFGHNRFVPEINTFGNVPYYYHCRGLEDNLSLYRYRAPSGSEVLMYREHSWYNSRVNPDNGTIVFELERRCNGLKTALVVYGVGDHGGGPTRRDIEAILEMQQWPVFPNMHFGTLDEFFHKAEAVRDGLPVVDHEINFAFTGCYSTQSRIKLANRRTEAALLDSERINALSHVVLGTEFPAERYNTAWQKVLFNHFHDILTGSCKQESREFAMGRYSEAIAVAQTAQSKAFERISCSIDTSMFPSDDCIARTISEGSGVGYGLFNYAGVPNPERGAGKTRVYTVFNTSSQHRHELVELTVWEYVGDLKHINVIDHEGNSVPFQLLDHQPQAYWGHFYVRLLIEADVPPMGYATYAVTETEIEEYPCYMLTHPAERIEYPNNDVILENSRLRARFDTGSGMLHSLINKSSGEELLAAPAGLHLVHTEDSDMSAWRIGRYLGMEPVTDTNIVSVSEGNLSSSITFRQRVMNSTVTMTVSLNRDDDALRYDFDIDWHETCKAQPWIPLLSYRLPLKKAAERILTDVPAGFAVRDARQQDNPALSYACAVSDTETAALICDCKYGYRLADNTLSVTLINTAGTPDPYPERGVHAIRLFVALTDGKPARLKNRAEALNRPMTAVPTAAHEGKLKPKDSLLTFEAEHSVLTSVRITDDDALTVRLYESGGSSDRILIRPPFTPAKAVLTDMNGDAISTACVADGKVTFSVAPHRIAEVRIFR